MIARVGFSILGQSYWQKAFANYKENPDINHEFVEMIEPYLKITIIAFMALNFLLCALVWRNRKFANWIIYYELMNNCLIQGFVPFNYGDFGHLINYMAVCSTFLAVANDLRPSIIAGTLTMAFTEFV